MTLYSKPNSPARRQNSFVPSTELSPPSIYFQTARPGFNHAVSTPAGTSFGSDGGHKFGMMSELTKALRSRPTITTRHGVVMVPEIDAGLERRAMSSAL